MVPSSLPKPAATQAIMLLHELVADHTLTPAQATVLRRALVRNENILIVGTTNSGKTTLLNALLAEIANLERIESVAIIDEARELVCNTKVVRYFHPTSWPDVDGQTTTEHLMACLRTRPDRVILGDLHSAECDLLINVWAECAGGGLCTTYGNSVKDALRLLLLRMTGRDKVNRVAGTLDVIVHITRAPDGFRVHDIAQVSGHSANEVSFVSHNH